MFEIAINYLFTVLTIKLFAAPTVGTRQMANLMYGVCVKMVVGYCGIEWFESSTNSFVVTGDPGVISPNDTGIYKTCIF